jgi:protein arginine kinase activator
MANPMKCQICSKPAKVHLTHILNNKIQKVDLCDECAKAKGVTDATGFGLADLVVKAALANGSISDQFICETCGFTQANFKMLGRLGCPDCWDRFRDVLEPILANMHRGTRHTGKSPLKLLARQQVRDQIAKLKADLKAAISTERYEDAARIRDELSQLQANLQPKPADHAV